MSKLTRCCREQAEKSWLLHSTFLHITLLTVFKTLCTLGWPQTQEIHLSLSATHELGLRLCPHTQLSLCFSMQTTSQDLISVQTHFPLLKSKLLLRGWILKGKFVQIKTFPGNCFNQVATAVKSLGSPWKGVYTLSRPSYSGLEIPSSFKVGLSSWMT